MLEEGADVMFFGSYLLQQETTCAEVDAKLAFDKRNTSAIS